MTDPQQNNKFEVLATEVGKLVDEKNKAYGDSFMKAGEFLKILYPTGIPPEKYIDALCIVRMFDKLMRIATKKDALGESPYRDLMGYALLGLFNTEQQAELDQKVLEVNERMDNFNKKTEEGILANLEKQGITLGAPPSLEERIIKLFKTHEELSLDQIAHLLDYSKFRPEQIQTTVQNMFFKGKLEYFDSNKTFRIVQDLAPLEAVIIDLLKQHKELDLQNLDELVPARWEILHVKEMIGRMIDKNILQYVKNDSTYVELVEIEVACNTNERDLLSYINKTCAVSVRDLEENASLDIQISKREVRESLQKLLIKGLVRTNDVLKIEITEEGLKSL